MDFDHADWGNAQVTCGPPSGGSPISSGHTYRLVNSGSGKVLDDPGSSVSDGTQLIQWQSNGGANQGWKATDLGGGFWNFTNSASGKAVDDPNSSTADGTAGTVQLQSR